LNDSFSSFSNENNILDSVYKDWAEEVSDNDFERDSNANLDLECLYSSPPKVEADDN
jgi:hypothetical protein